MTTLVEIPGVGEVEFPDSMTPGQISQAARRLSDQRQKDRPQGRIGTAERPGEARAISPMEFARARTREVVEDLPGISQFGAEAGPATAGTIAGAAAGAPAGPVGVIAGAAAGGLLGEFFAQETGVSPESRAALVLSGAAPVAGPIAGATLKAGRRGIGAMLTNLPPARAAAAQMTMRESVTEFESLGSKILSRQKGLTARSADDLFTAARRAGAEVDPGQLKSTQQALSELNKEISPLSDFPEAQRALSIVDRAINTLGGSATETGKVSFDTLIGTRQLVGAAVRQAERAAGIRLGSSKKLFKAMTEDLDTIAKGTTQARRPARIALAATARAKLEFSIRDLEGAVARFSRDVPGEDAVALNVVRLQKWLRDVTNPKSSKFDKNFSNALKDELPSIRKRLSGLSGIADAGSPAGPGSIVVRGIGARTGRTVVGAMTGGAFGPIGAGAGALIGASMPEIFTGALTSRAGAAFLSRAARLGKGELPAARWALLSQIVTRGAGGDPESEKGTTIGDLQRRAVGGSP